ncbi:MAG: VWA domain-containing protein [Bryobacterales bacterium]|nr:VWA domain-containing protein [Bryobacterales bacterium]MBV9400692.1 VWA domain-containing protein [Bryobacterales bacterium]
MLALAPSVTAQQTADSGTPVFRTGTNLVTVDVTVKDKAGKVIEGLKASDFAILEDGKQQKLSVFEFQKLSSEPAPLPALTLADQLELPKAPKTTITAATPGQVQYHDKRLLVFLFDFSSMQVADQLRAQDAALKFLNNKLTKDDLVAILLYTSTVQVGTDFTGDRELLTTIIKQLPIGEMSEYATLADTGDCNSPDTQAAFVADETEFNIFNTDQKLAAIEKVARMLASMPEKKQLIYFNGGINKTGIDNQAQLEASVNAAMKANVVIYPIDARGLMADPPGGDASKAGSRGAGAFNGSQYNSQRSSINDSQETLVTLAADTGGKAFMDSNDIELGIEQAQQTLSSYYILGYYTTNNAEDGKYRKISVKLTNGMSAKLDHRPGYWASKNWGKLNGQDKEQQLKEALSAGDPITDLPLALQVDYFRVGPTAYFVPVSVKIPGSVVELAAKGGAATTQLDFVGQIQDETRAVVGNVRDFIKVKLDSEAAKSGRKPFLYDAGFTLEPGRYQMKFLVRENLSGKMGTFETGFTVPDLSADTSGLKLSTIVWSNQREPLTAAVGTAEKLNKKTVAANPLIVGEEKVVPNITKVFRQNQNLYVSFDIYDAMPDPANAKARKVRVSMSWFNQRGAKAFEVGPLDFTQVADTRPEAVPVNIQVPLKDIAAGRYICQINVVDEAGRKFAFPRATLVVTP